MPLPLALFAASAAVNAVGAGLKYLHHKSDQKKADAEEASLSTPFYKVQNEYYQNRDLAANQASQGLPSATRDYLTTETQRGLTGSIKAIQDGGGDPNQIANLFDVYQAGINRTAAQDAQLHTANLQQFLERNTAVAGQKNAAFAINELQPYERKLKQLQERKKANIEGSIGAVSDFGQVLSSAATGFQNMGNGESERPATSGYNPPGMTNRTAQYTYDQQRPIVNPAPQQLSYQPSPLEQFRPRPLFTDEFGG